MTYQSQQTLLSILQIWAFGLLTGHLAAFAMPLESTWAFWPYSFLPTWLGWLLALSVGLLTLPLVSRGVSQLLRLTRPSHTVISPTRMAMRQGIFALTALACGLMFYLARLQHLRWGDSYFLTLLLPHPDPTVRVIYNWQAPLTVLLHQRLWQFVAQPWFGGTVAEVYAAVSIGCGVLFVYLLLNLAHDLARDRTEFVILIGLMLTSGSMQLFFGYVENYTLISVGLLIMMLLAWFALRGRCQPFWPILALSLTNAFHPSTVFIWPGMLLLSWLCYRRGYVRVWDGLAQTLLTPLLIGGAVFAIMEMGGHGVESLTGVDRPGGGDGIWFVPLWAVDPTNRWQRYTMVSSEHWLDWANLHLLISPFGLFLIVLIGLMSYRTGKALLDNQADRDYAAFVSLTAGLYVLWTFVWHPDYGAQKDWDLFAPSAFVYTLLAGFLLVRALPDRETLRQAGLLAIAVSLLHTAAWVWLNMQPLPRE